MRRPVIFCSFSLSREPVKHTSVLSAIQAAAPLRLGGSGLQTMSSIREQSFSASATSNAARWSEKQTSHSRRRRQNLHMNVAIFPGQIESSSVNFSVPRCFSCQLPDVQTERKRHIFTFHFDLCQDLNNFMRPAPGRRCGMSSRATWMS